MFRRNSIVTTGRPTWGALYFPFLFFLFLVLPSLFFLPNSFAEEHRSYADRLVQLANEKQLAESPQWLSLLHFQPHWLLPMSRSLVDDPQFFLDENGKYDAAAELEATIRSFFFDKFLASRFDKELQHAQCRFVARYRWLKEELEFDSQLLPEQSCERFKEWYAALDPGSLTLIFPNAYVNNPSSMFGHTFLRIDAKSQTEKTRLLAYGSSFGAETGNDGGVLFAIKGLFGGYHGFFNLVPYYEQVATYSDVENRDTWEYPLNFSDEEVRRVVEHLWELRGVYFDYYFFDENCSYHLLGLLDAGRAELAVSKDFPFWALPTDTMRSLVDSGVVGSDIVFRPAKATVIKHMLSEVPPRLSTAAKTLADGAIDQEDLEREGLETADQAAVLELAYEYVDYLRLRGSDDQSPLHARALQLLRERSSLGVSSPFTQVPTPIVRPDQGHRTARLSLGLAYDDKDWSYELGWRPVFHELVDPQGGYLRGAQIKFFDMRFRHREEEGIRLEELTPLNILSVSPRDTFFRPLSWSITTKIQRQRLSSSKRPLVPELSGGAGLSYSLSPKLLAFGLLNASLEFQDELEQHWNLGFGPKAGIFYDLNEHLQTSIQANLSRFFIDQERTSAELQITQRIAFSKNFSTRLSYHRGLTVDHYWSSFVLSADFFF